MGNTSAGKVPDGNSGRTDVGRGSTMTFRYSKTGRQTGRIAGGVLPAPNGQTVDANKRQVNDPRMT